MAEEKFKIEVLEQGINATFDKAGLQKFFDDEIAFYNRVAGIIDQDITFFGKNLGNPRIAANASRQLQSLKKLVDADAVAPGFMNKYLANAQSLDIVIGQGAIGKRAEQLMAQSDSAQAKWILWLCSKEWARADGYLEYLAPYRAAAFSSPSFRGYVDVQAAEQLRSEVTQTRTDVKTSQDDLNAFITQKTQLFDSLEELYRRKLVFDEPAISWEKVSKSKTWAWRIWLFIFAALIVLPIFLIAYDWNEISTRIVALTTTAQGGISLAGVATITVPGLLYAWLLKNVSRVFIQSLNLADDAAHRKTLAVTYLGLAENPKLEIDEAERALILNALFRPVSATPDDGGPPMGILDLIRKH